MGSLSETATADFRGWDLNRRPLGYESSGGLAGNPLISRRTSGTTGNWCFVHRAAAYPVFQGVSGWCGSKTGADDLWVLPKPLLGVFPPWPPSLTRFEPVFTVRHALVVLNRELRGVDSTTWTRGFEFGGWFEFLYLHQGP